MIPTTTKSADVTDVNAQETAEWLEALDEVIDASGNARAEALLGTLVERAASLGVIPPPKLNTPYLNTIAVDEEVPYPGDRLMERRIKSIIRWNAMAMVVRANKYDDGIGGHVSTYQSQATLVEVAFNHFFRGSLTDSRGEKVPGDFIYFQGHASPGVYSRAFVEGRLNEQHLKNFRHELRDTPGLSSYPHPWLMPDFWQFPTVSMGLGPINSIYHARFLRYLENREIIGKTDRKVWAFLGDGETDEPESLGALTLASRESLDNLIFVVNCNLQRLDGPVRGNGKIIQELEAAFRGAGWNVIKVVWGADWDSLLERDKSGLLLKRMEECVDGDYQSMKARGGAVLRREFFGKYPELLDLVAGYTDEQLERLRRGGHDPVKVYNAYKRATETTGMPTVVLAKTIKGYGLGEAGEGRNVAHNVKKVEEDDLKKFRTRFEIPLTDSEVDTISFYKFAEDSAEAKYIRERRAAMGGPVPARTVKPLGMTAPPLETFQESLNGSKGRVVSTTGAFGAILKAMLRDPQWGKYVVPIIPDEARTFGLESLFKSNGIYSSKGQLYKPVDQENNPLLYYREAKNGQVLEEGITEAGSMGSFTAAGTAYANLGVPMLPFYIYYSMFGYQRVGDQVWAFGDSRGRGFMIGGTAGRTTLNGEGLQHQDGHSHVLFNCVPNCITYDPTWAYELAVIIQEGIRRMHEVGEDVFYYVTVGNENYVHPAMPEGDREGIRQGILRGLYMYRAALKGGESQVQLWGNGSILNHVLAAQEMLQEKYGIAADVWSATSLGELRRDAIATERWNRLNPAEPARKSYVEQTMEATKGPIVSASDYMKVMADQLAPWLGGRLVSLGTDGFGRSESRQNLRRHFEVDAESITAAVLSRLARDGQFDKAKAAAAIRELGLSGDKPDPARA